MVVMTSSSSSSGSVSYTTNYTVPPPQEPEAPVSALVRPPKAPPSLDAHAEPEDDEVRAGGQW